MLATPLITLLLASLAAYAAAVTGGERGSDVRDRAVKDGQAEVDLATLAQKKAGSEQTRTLASELRSGSRPRERGVDGDCATQGDQRRCRARPMSSGRSRRS